MPDHYPRHDTSPDITAHRIAISPTDQSREKQTRSQGHGDVILVLESDDGVGFEVAFLDQLHLRVCRAEEYPAHMRVEKAFLGVVSGSGLAVSKTRPSQCSLRDRAYGSSSESVHRWCSRCLNI